MINKISFTNNTANNPIKSSLSFKGGTMVETLHIKQDAVRLTSQDCVEQLDFYTKNLPDRSGDYSWGCGNGACWFNGKWGNNSQFSFVQPSDGKTITAVSIDKKGNDKDTKLEINTETPEEQEAAQRLLKKMYKNSEC